MMAPASGANAGGADSAGAAAEAAAAAAEAAEAAAATEAAVEESRQRFIARAIEQEAVWLLENDEGAACVDSASDEEAIVLLFWSDRASAKRARKTEFKEYEVVELSLLEFLFKWLSGMADDEVLVGVNWTGAPEGLELDPEQLQDDLLESMGEDMSATYYDALQAALDPALDPAEQTDDADFTARQAPA